MRGKKGSDYEGGHRVPCFIYWPDGRITGGKSVSRLTAHIDILPTLVEACGLSVAGEEKFDGMNLLPILKDNKAKWPGRVIVTEGKVNNRETLYKSSCVINDNWRLVSGTELFDIHSDPGQEMLINNETKIDELREQYTKWYSSVSESFDLEYYFIYKDSLSSTPFVTMDLLPDGRNEKSKSVWNQSAVKKGVPDNGVWNIEIPENDMYVFHLCRLPLEATSSILNVEKVLNMQIASASVIIDGKEAASSPNVIDGQIRLTTEVTKGKHKISAYFQNNEQERFSAYYLYISRKK
jgi:hypothetical protein